MRQFEDVERELTVALLYLKPELTRVLADTFMPDEIVLSGVLGMYRARVGPSKGRNNWTDYRLGSVERLLLLTNLRLVIGRAVHVPERRGIFSTSAEKTWVDVDSTLWQNISGVVVDPSLLSITVHSVERPYLSLSFDMNEGHKAGSGDAFVSDEGDEGGGFELVKVDRELLRSVIEDIQIRVSHLTQNKRSAAEPIGAPLLSELERLGSLREKGLLNEEQFEAAKNKLLGL